MKKGDIPVVAGELREREKLSPVVLLVVAVIPDVLFQCLISAFTFRMVTGGEVKLHIESISERPVRQTPFRGQR